MFGLEGHKKKKPSQEFVFDLEKELKDPKKSQKLHKEIDARVQKMKELLRTGDNQDEFTRFGLLLQGYLSLLKVINRFADKSK